MKEIKEQLKQNRYIYSFVKKVKRCYRYSISVYGEEIVFYIKCILKKFKIVKTDKYVETLKNKYQGEKIFIVATGPSLKVEDLELLKRNNAITISMNGVFKLYDKTDWRPAYYVADDYWLIKKYAEIYPDIDYSSLSICGAVMGYKTKKYVNASNKDKIGYVEVNYFDHWWTHYSKRFKYNKDIRYGNYDCYTVTNFAINIADYMGAKEIYLLGVDCNYSSSLKHAGERETNVTEEELKNAKATETGMINGYKAINKYIDKKVKVYNATRGGELEVFTRITLEEAIADM